MSPTQPISTACRSPKVKSTVLTSPRLRNIRSTIPSIRTSFALTLLALNTAKMLRATRPTAVQPTLARRSGSRSEPATCCNLALMSPDVNLRHVTQGLPSAAPTSPTQRRVRLRGVAVLWPKTRSMCSSGSPSRPRPVATLLRISCSERLDPQGLAHTLFCRLLGLRPSPLSRLP